MGKMFVGQNNQQDQNNPKSSKEKPNKIPWNYEIDTKISKKILNSELSVILENLQSTDRREESFEPGGLVDFNCSLPVWSDYARRGYCPFPPENFFRPYKNEEIYDVPDEELVIRLQEQLKLAYREIARLKQSKYRETGIGKEASKKPESAKPVKAVYE